MTLLIVLSSEVLKFVVVRDVAPLVLLSRAIAVVVDGDGHWDVVVGHCDVATGVVLEWQWWW